MNLAFFFEGTGQGIAGTYTNVTRMRDLCVADAEQVLHLESGPGTHFGVYIAGMLHGVGWRQIVRHAQARFEEQVRTVARPRVFVFGFSRGALIARHFASWLGEREHEVAYLGLWDTVDSTIGLDVPETCPANVRCARHAVARDERRRYFSLVPLRAPADAPRTRVSQLVLSDAPADAPRTHVSQLVLSDAPVDAPRTRVSQLVFPGVHSDVGGLYADDHRVADVTLDWIARGAVREGLRLKPGVSVCRRHAVTSAKLHESLTEPSNLWGALGAVHRTLTGIRRHAICRYL